MEYQPHGYRLWPSRKTTYFYPRSNPRKLLVVSNSDGFRSYREFDEPDERMRIMVVGDSMVFGEGVEADERFTNVLETMQSTWRIDNLGMTGYGPGLMLRTLETVGLDSKPDIVIFCMYTDIFRRVNPHYAGAGFKLPRFKLKNGELASIPYPKVQIWDRSRSFWAVRKIYWQYTNAAFDLNDAILNRFLRLAERHNFRPVIIFLPGRADTQTDKRRRIWLRRYSVRNKCLFLDLTEPIHSKRKKEIFIPNNWHYNAYGHHVVAAELYRFLLKELR
jgi:hypothetical protein